MTMMMDVFIAHGSIGLNAQCAEGDFRQKMDRKKSREDRERFRYTVSPADTEKANLIRKQVSFQTSAERCTGICFPDCLWQGIPELEVRESSETKLLFGVFFSSTWYPCA